MEVEAKKIMLKKGVYATATEIDGRTYQSITNIGTCPTVCTKDCISVETHVFDFNDEIYGEEVLVNFFGFVREEKKFKSIEELQKQIEKDIQFVKNYDGV
jgi:riboflavin kinase/FMN adenylyltransferase